MRARPCSSTDDHTWYSLLPAACTRRKLPAPVPCPCRKMPSSLQTCPVSSVFHSSASCSASAHGSTKSAGFLPMTSCGRPVRGELLVDDGVRELGRRRAEGRRRGIEPEAHPRSEERGGHLRLRIDMRGD